MIDAARLLADLQGDLTELVDDLKSRVDAEAVVAAPLRAEYQAAFDARRTGRTFAEWSEDRLTQVGVAWLLACVFVRFGEDNALIDDARIAGPGRRATEARAAQQDFFVAHPNLSDRDYLHDVFRRSARLPGLSGVLAPGESPLWMVDPPADTCTRLLERFRAVDDDGGLVHDFADPAWSTRFLGDLYQDLSAFARDNYALLQTPEFVEELILDRTLDPAIDTFGLAATRLIDPTCGSGHFLLGAFARLWQAWKVAEPATYDRVLAQRVLDAVWGVDLNPFAAAIATFRLLVAALQACRITRLAGAPDFTIHVTIGDSLLWGAREGQLPGMEAASQARERQYLYKTEHAAALQETFGQTYTAVVGNPPYIIARDPALNAAYRQRYDSCYRQYSLGVPFTERFFELATPWDPGNTGRSGGYVGMITTNSFMKREFGKKLIEDCLPHWDLTHVIDTSGAYIPGHGTPTVILFGRNQLPVGPTIRTALGIRGEPTTPADPAKGLVWTAIVDQLDHPGSESPYISVSDTDRARFAKHPWSIGGGGAAELKEQIEALSATRLETAIDEIGFGAVTREDDAFRVGEAAARKGVEARHVRPLVAGEELRNWGYDSLTSAIWPYNPETLDAEAGLLLTKFLWPWRRQLSERSAYGSTQLERGLFWWEYSMFFRNRFRTPLSIAFAFVATHNHFLLDRGGKVFKQSAPVIKLPQGASIDDHLDLLGLLNSSVGCFWMQQVFHNKGAGGGARVDQGYAPRGAEAFLDTFEFDGTKLQQFPLPAGAPPRELARRLDSLAHELADQLPVAVAARGVPTREALDEARTTSERLAGEMVALQEELDWHCLHLYGLTDEALVVPDGAAVPSLALGERAFEIVLARQVAAGDVETAWFARHRSTPITDAPADWPGWYRALVERRVALIEADRDVGLVERPEHKRRWQRPAWEEIEMAALGDWLLERLEDRELWFDGGRARCRSVRQLADRVAADPAWMGVARLWAGATDIDPVAVVEELVGDQHVPAQAAARYKPAGLAKRAQWEHVWAMQRAEDRGEAVGRIPVPPKYAPADFAKVSFWSQRGKLDVPKERFTSVPGAERDGTTVLTWAGFDHAQAAQALATALHERQTVDGWTGSQLVPLLVALAEELPWVAQWHPDPDPAIGQPLAVFYQGMIDQTLSAFGATSTTLTEWRPPAAPRGRRRSRQTSSATSRDL